MLPPPSPWDGDPDGGGRPPADSKRNHWRAFPCPAAAHRPQQHCCCCSGRRQRRPGSCACHRLRHHHHHHLHDLPGSGSGPAGPWVAVAPSCCCRPRCDCSAPTAPTCRSRCWPRGARCCHGRRLPFRIAAAAVCCWWPPACCLAFGRCRWLLREKQAWNQRFANSLNSYYFCCSSGRRRRRRGSWIFAGFGCGCLRSMSGCLRRKDNKKLQPKLKTDWETPNLPRSTLFNSRLFSLAGCCDGGSSTLFAHWSSNTWPGPPWLDPAAAAAAGPPCCDEDLFRSPPRLLLLLVPRFSL